MSDLYAECPLHGRWIFPAEATVAHGNFQRWHRDHKWPVSTRRFPAKSRKRVAS